MRSYYPKYIVNSHNSTIGDTEWAKGLNSLFSKRDINITRKYTKSCSVSLILREMQNKATMRFHLLLKWLLSKKGAGRQQVV